MSQQSDDGGGGCGSVGQRSQSSPGSPEAPSVFPERRDQIAGASAAGGSVASPSFDVSDFEEHRWYLNANLAAGSSGSQPESSEGADRSFSLVSENPGPSFCHCEWGDPLFWTVRCAIGGGCRSSRPPSTGHEILLGRWLLAADLWIFRAFGEYVWFSFQETRGTAARGQPRKAARSSDQALGAANGSFLNAVRDREVLSWKQKRDKERTEALSLWESLVIGWPSNLPVIGQLLSATSPARKSMIEDLLGGKAPATLSKRYRSILGYDLFLRARGIGFPGSEDLFYAYLCQLRDDGKPASTRKAVLEAVTFVRFVLGIPELATLGESKRCHGSARLRDF